MVAFGKRDELLLGSVDESGQEPSGGVRLVACPRETWGQKTVLLLLARDWTT